MKWLKQLLQMFTPQRGVLNAADRPLLSMPTRIDHRQRQPAFEALTLREGFIAVDTRGNSDLLRSFQNVANGVPYMYDELRLGRIPTQEEAKVLLADYKAGIAIPHGISEPGWQGRLEDIAAGRPVDPQFWKR